MLSGLLLLAIAGTPALAEDNGVLFGAAGGYFWTDPNENLDHTWTVVGRLGYQLDRHFALETEVGFLQGYTRSFGYGYDALTPRAHLMFNLSPDTMLQPFVVAGPGAFWKKVRRSADIWEATPKDGENWGNYKNPDTDFIADVGYGMFLQVAGPFAFRVDFRSVLNFGTEDHGDIADRFVDWELTGGFALRGAERKRDTDGDGILDRYDQCVEEPEDHDRFQDDDGCPDRDNDEDGIVDERDDCPLDAEDIDGWQDRDGCPEDDNDLDGIVDWNDECRDRAEDIDGWRDEDGCPDPDNDKDGILDLQDRCPGDPEDPDGWMDEDGCPDPDNDGDAIPDFEDSCPNDRETWNKFEDDDGCPDEVPPPPPEVERFTGVIHGINFKSGSDEILVSSYQLLDEAAEVLSRYDELRLEVQGHTDSDGGDQYNLELSAGRAKSVVDYLIRRGVAPERLEWVGYGEARPLVENASVDAKAVNRRVEFHLIQDAAAE